MPAIRDRYQTELGEMFNTVLRQRYGNQWDEQKHPRANDGKFSSVAGGGASGDDDSQRSGQSSAERPTGDADGDNVPNALESASCQSCDTEPPPPGGYTPDPAEGHAARVGVPGDAVPPPPKAADMRLPNLTPEERAIETEALQWAFGPNGTLDDTAEEYEYAVTRLGLGEGNRTFGTDDVKELMPFWANSMEDRAKNNTAVHQAANAVAKKAFQNHLDKLKPGSLVMVTAGGVAAGKGFAIGLSPDPTVAKAQSAAQAIWDTAGEQNSTELDWVASECEKRGLRMSAAFVHADPYNTIPRVVSRAAKKGRMVDARAYADSYAHGGRNFQEFAKKHANSPHVDVHYLDNSGEAMFDVDPNTGEEKLRPGTGPKLVDSLPESATTFDAEHLYQHALSVLSQDKIGKTPVPSHVKQGGAAGVRIWGPPRTAQR